jgi:hypothetical protein
VTPKLVLAGVWKRLIWSFTTAVAYRADATIGTLPPAPGNTVGTELQFGAALSYADFKRRFSVGPELVSATVLTKGNAFRRDYTTLELLIGGQYNIVNRVQVGVAAGIGILSEPGTPDFRILFRASYSPFPR